MALSWRGSQVNLMARRLKELLINVEYHALKHFVSVFWKTLNRFKGRSSSWEIDKSVPKPLQCLQKAISTRRSFKSVEKTPNDRVFWLLKQTHELLQGLKDTTTHLLCDGV
ncbi:hypothetical protein TNCT_529411 [Trichonephila clavata]|uniref:Uncharacterized protein n=1 Tax=Trichonephila clavata TaxID=2740835 RepID=A0A8X6GBE7_TRICU|nr:hypothetical protein TNCT_529411 [Trichonephila clavata]